jgi:hypothetical protein
LEEKVSEAKGPYTTEPCERHAGRLKIVFYKGMISCGDRHNQQVSCDALNEAWEIGRASRDGLRSQLRSNNTVLFDVASLVGAGKYFDAIELCHAKVFGNNQALEDDGEGR